jgi:hypothetical protein
MDRSTLERLAPLTGIAFVVLIVASFIIGGESPDVDDSTADVIDFWSENDSANIWSAVLGGLATVFLVWFGGSMRVFLRRGEGEPGRLSAIAFAGFLLAAAGGGMFCGFQFSAADTVGDVPEDVTQTLSVLTSDFFIPFAAGNLVAFVASGLAIVRFGVLPSWLGWVALVIGIASLTPIGFFAFLAGGIWILVASVLIYQEGAQGPTPTTVPPTTP